MVKVSEAFSFLDRGSLPSQHTMRRLRPGRRRRAWIAYHRGLERLHSRLADEHRSRALQLIDEAACQEPGPRTVTTQHGTEGVPS